MTTSMAIPCAQHQQEHDNTTLMTINSIHDQYMDFGHDLPYVRLLEKSKIKFQNPLIYDSFGFFFCRLLKADLSCKGACRIIIASQRLATPYAFQGGAMGAYAFHPPRLAAPYPHSAPPRSSKNTCPISRAKLSHFRRPSRSPTSLTARCTPNEPIPMHPLAQCLMRQELG